jgi:lipopolysaccharide biosynthesis protein
MNADVKVVAFYLPQFHPIPENDEWWGKGFTEWTNVGKAKPLFKGHYQPRVPADLGYYDLRMPEIREAQATMAKEAGIYGFCYWHYWFGDGKQLLERPFNEVLTSGKPDFPFCLGWANESWEEKSWNANDAKTNRLLIEQKYPGKEDNDLHFFSLLNAFKDKRYIRVNGKPVFLIYKPEKYKDIHFFIEQWNHLARINGLEGSILLHILQNFRNIKIY